MTSSIGYLLNNNSNWKMLGIFGNLDLAQKTVPIYTAFDDTQHTSNTSSVAWSTPTTQPSNSLNASNQYMASSAPASASTPSTATFNHGHGGPAAAVTGATAHTATAKESNKPPSNQNHSQSQQSASATSVTHTPHADALGLYPQSQHYAPYMGDCLHFYQPNHYFGHVHFQ